MLNWKRLMTGALCVIAGLMLDACAGQRTIYLDNGAKGYLVTCKGYLNSWETCLLRAGKICRTRGYDTIRSEEYDRTLLIACNTPAH